MYCLTSSAQGALHTLMSHAVVEFLKNIWTKSGWEDQLLEVAENVVVGLSVEHAILHLRIFGSVWPCLQDRNNPSVPPLQSCQALG